MRTYVIGIGAALGNLSSVAEAGGTREPVVVETGDVQAQILEAMQNVLRTPSQCEFLVPEQGPEGQAIDIDRAVVLYTAAATGIAQEIPKVNDITDCASEPGAAWYYDPPEDPTTIQLCPESCDRLGAGSLSVEFACIE